MAEQQESEGGVAVANGSGSGQDTLTVTDNRTGKTYELEITDGTVKGMDLRQIKVDEDDFGLMSFDPAYTNTASCRSAITYIDGEAGILEYRGYPIEQLCEQATYLEVAYLIVNGELPTRDQLDEWVHEVTIHTYVHENVKEFLDGFRYDAHPMGMLQASVGALSTFYPGAKHIKDEEERHMATIRLIAKVPTLAAFADVGSSEVDPYSACAAGIGALYGPLHGGANEAVLRMLDRIENVDNIPDFLEAVKNREEKLMGFGHRVYKNFDPRAKIIKKNVEEVFEVTGMNPKLEIAVEIEKRALEDYYINECMIYPKVDCSSGILFMA